MALTPGTRLGPYEIVAFIGAGGMGEVYRARDPKLERDVAIKVLPESVAGSPERLARFEREAKVLAALNHRNIAQISAVEHGALVMELVEGETLAGPLGWKRPSSSRGRSRRPWKRLTRGGSCIAISSRRTSSTRPKAWSRCWTSGWRR